MPTLGVPTNLLQQQKPQPIVGGYAPRPAGPAATTQAAPASMSGAGTTQFSQAPTSAAQPTVWNPGPSTPVPQGPTKVPTQAWSGPGNYSIPYSGPGAAGGLGGGSGAPGGLGGNALWPGGLTTPGSSKPPVEPKRTPLPQDPYEQVKWDPYSRTWITETIDPRPGTQELQQKQQAYEAGLANARLALEQAGAQRMAEFEARAQAEAAAKAAGYTSQQIGQQGDIAAAAAAKADEYARGQTGWEAELARMAAEQAAGLKETGAVSEYGRTKELTGYQAQLAAEAAAKAAEYARGQTGWEAELAQKAAQADYERMQADRAKKAEAELAFQKEQDALDLALWEKMKSQYGASGGSGGGGTGGGVSLPGVPASVVLPGPTSGPSAAAQAAAFARAKDRIGAGSQGAMMSLKDEFARRGLAGTAMEGSGMAGVIQTGQGQLGEAGRDIALEEAQRAQEVEDRNIQAALAQRAQDIGVRAQDIGVQEGAANRALQQQAQLQALFQAMRQRNYLY